MPDFSDRFCASGRSIPYDRTFLCIHCGIRNRARPRGLCFRCFYTPGVREKFPCGSKFARKVPVWQEAKKVYPLPPFPTKARPGSPEKIEVLSQRLQMECELFHPHDAVMEKEEAA